MARSILVLIAALPALAQYNAALYNVKPSGGAVGQVCFYETVANGSNKVCLMGPAAAGGDRAVTFPDATLTLAGIDIAQTFTAAQTFNSGIFSTTIQAGGFNFAVDSSGNTEVLSLDVNGAATINSSRRWVPASFLFQTDGSSEIGSSGANRPGTIHVGAGTAGGSGLIVYNGTVGRMIVAPPYLSLYDNSSVEVIRLDSNSGDAIFSGAITVASCTGCAGVPVVDTTGLSKGSSDATKVVRFEVDGFTAGTTRVLTPPNADITIAGIDLAQTWSAAQTFGSGIFSTTIQAGGFDFSVDSSGNTDVLSLSVNSTATINSSRHWVPSSFLFGTDGSSSIGSASANRPGTIHVGAGTAGGLGILVYNGTVGRILANASQISLYNNSSSETLRLDTSAGDIIFTGAITQTSTSRISSGGVFNAASYNVAGTEVVSSGRVGKFVSLDINGTANVIDSSRNASINNLTIAGTCTGSACGVSPPITDTTGIAKGSSDATKIVRFEVDGFTTGTTRVLTPPNANITIAGIDLLQTWSAGQNFAAITAAQIGVSTGFFVDGSGNTEVLSLEVNGTNTINSSRAWVAGNLLFGTDSTYSVGATTSGRPASYYAGGGGFYAYSGSTLRAFMDISNFALYNGSAVNKYIIDTSTGNTTSAGYNSSTSYQVSGTEVVSSGRVGKFVSLDINGTTDRINSSGVFNAASYSVAGTSVVDSSRNASFVSLTINGTSAINSSRNTNFNNLVWTNQLWGPYTADTGLSFASSAGKIAYYDTSGVFKGWIPVLP